MISKKTCNLQVARVSLRIIQIVAFERFLLKYCIYNDTSTENCDTKSSGKF